MKRGGQGWAADGKFEIRDVVSGIYVLTRMRHESTGTWHYSESFQEEGYRLRPALQEAIPSRSGSALLPSPI